jgi:DNA repair protein RadA
MKKKEILQEIEKDILENKAKEQEEQEQKSTLQEPVKSEPSEKEDKQIFLEDEEEPKVPELGIQVPAQPILLEITDIKDVGTTTAEKLNEMGIYDISDLAIASAVEIHERIASTKHSMDFCEKLVVFANQYLQQSGILDKPIISSEELMKKDVVRKRFSTGDDGLDEWFGGGIESRAVTELYGRFKSGKTQICYSTAVATAASGKKVLFIDTENTYGPERSEEICRVKKYNAQTVHKNILVMKPRSASILVLYLKELARHIKEHKIELIIVDSIIALHRAEFIGRSNLSLRQQQLSRIMSYLVRNSEHFDIGVIITNQVLESPDPFRPGQFATGGNIISHASTHRVLLRPKTPTDKTGYRSFSTAIMEDSPRYARTELQIELGTYGIRSIDPSKPLPKK